jgi:hypothetical protein
MSDHSSPSSRDAAGSPGSPLVVRWVEAHNDRDLDGMIACATEEVEFHPLRLTLRQRPADFYVGHDGLRLWFEDLRRSETQHQLRVGEIRQNGADEVVLTGSVEMPASSTVAEFYGIYDIPDGLIVRAHHWISDRRTMEDLGLVQPLE